MREEDNVLTLKTSSDRKRVVTMFLDTLSTTVLQLCDLYQWSYEAAAEHCELSARYFGDIVRRRTAPTIKTLEKLCIGFRLSPNDLLITGVPVCELLYRFPMAVTQCCGYNSWFGFTSYPVCPHCKNTFEREYQAFCDRCGQKLSWKGFDKAELITPDSIKKQHT